MSESAITPPGDDADRAGGAAAVGDLRDVRELDARGVVAAIVASRRIADEHEARLLALAVHFVDLHPVAPGRPAASWDPGERLPVTAKPQARRDRSERIAGEGTPGVAQYAVEELGAALGVSYRTALQLVADALELCYRLPRLWGLVQAGRLQAWRARQVAQLTVDVSPVVAGFVDRQLAFDAAKNRVPTLARLRALVHEALLQCDPEVATGREEAALARRGVWFDHRDSTATTQLTATLDTLDALDLDNTLSDLADQLRQLGDSSPLDIRRAHALGQLAHRDDMLDLTTGDGSQPDDEGSMQRPVLRLRNKTTTHLYVHVSLADLLTGRIGAVTTAAGEGEADQGLGQRGEPVSRPAWSRNSARPPST